MGSPAIFKGSRTGLLTSKGLHLKDGSIVDNDGVPNFIKNGHAEINTTGWATYADTAGASPVDGTGGSANITWTRSTTTPLAGAGSFLFTKDAVNRQGQGASYDFTIDPAFQARVINIQFDYLVSSGTFVAGTSSADSDVTVWIYDVTNSTLIQPSSYKLLSNSSTISDSFQSSFQTSATGTSYRLILHCGTTSASAYTLKLDNFQVTPTEYAYGTPVTDWVAFTPATLSAGTTNPTMTWNDLSDARWRRVGDSMQIFMNLATTSVSNIGSGVYFFEIPTGYTIDSSKTSNLYTTAIVRTDRIGAVGFGSLSGNGSTTGWTTELGSSSTIYPASLNSVARYLVLKATSNGTMVGSSNYALATSGFFNYTINATIPITGWSSSVQTSDQTSTRVVDFVGSSTTGQSITANTTKLTFTAYKDSHSAWSTDTYTVPVAGDYSVSLSYYQTTSGAMAAYAQVNGADPGSGKAYLGVAGGSAGFAGSGTVILYNLKVGDAITIKGDATQTLSAGNRTLSISRISGPNQIAASETVSARGINSSGQTMTNGSFTVLQTPTILDNTHGALATNGEFTVPIAGRYLFGAYSTTTGNTLDSGDKIMSIYVDGVEKARGSRDLITSVNAGTGISTTLICKAGEKITARFFHNNGVNRSLEAGAEMNYFYAVKVGN